MQKKLLFGFATMMLFLIPIVSALQICPGDTIRETCNIITPVMTCSSNYTILNENGTIVRHSAMSSWNLSQYSFILTNISDGRYMIRLCDNTTREISVTAALTYIGTPSKELALSFDMGTTAGVMVMLTFLVIWFILLYISVASRIPWVMFMTGIFTLMLGVIICFKMSLVVGGLVCLFAIGLFIWSFYI